MRRLGLILVCIALAVLLVASALFWRPPTSTVCPLTFSFLGYTNLTPALQRGLIGDTNSTPGSRYGVFRITNRSSSKVVRHGPFYPETASGEYGLSDFPTATLPAGGAELVFV